MNKKVLNILLLIGVLFIWGILIYKYVSGNSSDDQNYLTSYNHQGQALSYDFDKEEFEVRAYKRDPFLGKVVGRNGVAEVSRNSGVQSKRKSKQVTPVVPIVWPKIEYLGYIQEKNTNAPLLLLKVDGRFLRKRAPFQFSDDLMVLEFYQDSVQMEYKKEVKMIRK